MTGAAIRRLLDVHPGLPWAPPENPAHRSGLSGGDYFQHSAPGCFGRYSDYEGDPFVPVEWQTSPSGIVSRRSGSGMYWAGTRPNGKNCDGPGEAS